MTPNLFDTMRTHLASPPTDQNAVRRVRTAIQQNEIARLSAFIATNAANQTMRQHVVTAQNDLALCRRYLAWCKRNYRW